MVIINPDVAKNTLNTFKCTCLPILWFYCNNDLLFDIYYNEPKKSHFHTAIRISYLYTGPNLCGPEK